MRNLATDWRPIPGTDATFYVSHGANGGQVYSVRRDQCVKRSLTAQGYFGVALGTYRRRALVHNLILEAFVGPRPSGMYGRHLNDIKTDNRLENLAWGTPKQNSADSLANGRFPTGDRHGTRTKPQSVARGMRNNTTTHTTALVNKVRERYANVGGTYAAVAAEFGLPRQTVRNWIVGEKRAVE